MIRNDHWGYLIIKYTLAAGITLFMVQGIEDLSTPLTVILTLGFYAVIDWAFTYDP